MSDCAVVLVNWRGAADTIECLASLMALRLRPIRIVVVDNASGDDSVEKISAWCAGQAEAAPAEGLREIVDFPRRAPANLAWAVVDEAQAPPTGALDVLIVRAAANLGFASGNNIGMRFAQVTPAAFFWLLNTDTVVDADALGALVRRAEQRPDAGMIGSTLRYYGRPGVVQALGGAQFDERTCMSVHLGVGSAVVDVPTDPADIERRMSYVVGASMLITRAMWELVGPMCEDYFLYFEEIDWAVRARPRFRLAYAPDSHVFHKVGGSSMSKEAGISTDYLYRNRLKFARRYSREHVHAVQLHMFIQLLQFARVRRWGHVKAIWSALRQDVGHASA